ncbi:hypothetical protein LTS12_018109 [Elasticomyces elasticus]|nr:hypothetical protein LTS12_018109 [Elasticomyces elasticus]
MSMDMAASLGTLCTQRSIEAGDVLCSVEVLDLVPKGPHDEACVLVPHTIRNNADARKALSSSMSQPTSWSTISVSKSVLETILLTHEVMPEFLDVVGCFQEKAASVDLAYCIPFVQKKQNDILEYAYGFKYPESNGRSDGGEQWSLRQGAIYHQYHVVEQRSVWIVINARPNSEALQRVSQHLAKIQSIAQSKQFPFAIDELILPAHLRMCKAYLRSHERTIIQLVWSIRSSI